jgi:hypothetical protein
MGLAHSPSIVTKNLSFAYDMNNIQKSWKGKPATNYIPYPYASYDGSSFVLGYNYPNNGATYTYVTGVSNPVNAPGVMQYFTGASDYKFFSVDSTAVPSTGTYTFSYYARIVGGSTTTTNLNNQQLWRDSVIGDQAVTGDWNPTLTTEWKRYSTTGPVQSGSALQYFVNHSGSLTGGYTIQYCGFQLESGSFASPLVIGTRSTTQAIVDQTNNNTITAASLTYASDNTFSFNGSTNYISTTNTGMIHYTGNFTYSCWVNFSALPGLGTIFENGFYTAGILIRFETNVITVYADYSISTYAQSFSFTPTLGVWYNLVFTRIGNSLLLYSNGVLLTTNPFGTNISVIPGNNIMYIGMSQHAAGQCFNGRIANVSVYNKELSAAEVLQNFNALKGRYGL